MPEAVLEKRVDKLEQAMMELVYQARRTEMSIEKLSEEMKEFKEEMRAFREESERDRKTLHEEITLFKEEAERDRKALHEEMQAFKEEMRAFREESERDRKTLHEEITLFKEEAERDRKALHEEMQAFKEEMSEFKRQQQEENKRKNKEWSNLAKKMGTLYEDLIAPALRPALSKYFNCDVSMEGQRMFRKLNGECYEVDAIAACKDKVFMIEVRSTPRQSDIKEIKEKAERFFEFFPEFKNKKLIIIFGSITFPENVIKYASRSGVYVIGWREWEYMDILNFEDVRL